MLLHDAVRDGQTEPGPGANLLGREERLEHVRQHLPGDAGPVVDDLRLDRAATFAGARSHHDAGAALAVVDGLLGVEQEVQEHLLELARVAHDRREPRGEVALDTDTRQRELVQPERQGSLDHLVEVEGRALGRALAREEEKVPDDLRHPVRLRHDHLDRPLHRGRDLAREQELAVADDDAQRVVQLVGDACDELAERRHLRGVHELHLGVPEAREAVAGARVQARVLEGERGLVGEGLERLELVGREEAAGLEPERQSADQALVGEQGNPGGAAEAVGGGALAELRRELDGRIGQDVGGHDDLPLGDRASGDALARTEDEVRGGLRGHAGDGDHAQGAVVGLVPQDGRALHLHQLEDPAGEQCRDPLHLEARRQLARQPRQHLGDVAPPLRLAVETRVLDGHGRLREEHIDDVARLRAEAERLRVAQRHDREQLRAREHRIRRGGMQPPATPTSGWRPGRRPTCRPRRGARGGARPSRRPRRRRSAPAARSPPASRTPRRS